MPSLGFLNAFRFDEERVQCRPGSFWPDVNTCSDTSQRVDFSFFDTRVGFSKP